MSEGTPIIIKKKKAHGGHAHHGGSWKVAYADFVTAMMAFFMVMWIMGLSDQTRAQIQGYFNDPLGFVKNEPKSLAIVSPPSSPGAHPTRSTTPDPTAKDEKQLQKVKEKLEAQLTGDKALTKILKNVEVTITNEGLRIELVESHDAAFFKSGSYQLTPAAWPIIKKIAPIIADTHRKFIVEGHTDSVPYPGKGYDNWDLSGDRANMLRHALEKFGVNDVDLAGIRALADTQLKYPNDPTNEKNRRVTVLLPWKPDKETGIQLPKDELSDSGTMTPNIKPPGVKGDVNLKSSRAF